MIQAHYIRPNESSRWPNHYLYLDTESWLRRTRHGAGVQSWRCGVTAYDGWHRHHKAPRPTVWARHETPEELWAYVEQIAPPRARLVLVAHNLGYDVRISAMFEILPRRGWALEKVGFYRQNCTITWRHQNGCALVCVDSHSWLPTSLAKIAEALGVEKMPDPAEDDDEGWWARCESDVVILRRAMTDCWARLRDDDAGTFQHTGAGMAWANWRHAHYTHQVFVHESAEARLAEEAATYTGRNEVWRWGNQRHGPYYELDLGMAYARAAGAAELPVELHSHVYGVDGAHLVSTSADWRILYRAEVTTSVPVLPVRHRDGIFWPVGTFTGWWWDVELEMAMAAGALVCYFEAYRYRAAPALTDWASWVIDAVEGDTHGYSPVQKMMLKHWSRALIGRFGMRYDRWVPYGSNPAGDVGLMACLDHESGELSNILLLGGRSLISTSREYGDDAVPAIQGAVMAECRVRLWELMVAAGFGNVYYVDTDSLVVNGVGYGKLIETSDLVERYAVRVKTVADSMTLYGPRQLVIAGERRFAGVPRNGVDEANGRVRGELWETTKRALEAGRTSTVATMPVVWTPLGTDRRRRHMPGGRTEAYEVDVVGPVAG